MLLEPGRLVPRVVEQLKDVGNELWLSPISVWEAVLLAEKGRVSFDLGPVEGVKDALRQMPVREAILNRDVALASRTVSLPHHDPADRFIAATAQVYGLTLVTQDERFLESGDLDLLENH